LFQASIISENIHNQSTMTMHFSRFVRIALLTLVVAGALIAQSNTTQAPPPPLKVGDKARDFIVHDLSGKGFKLSALLKNKAAVLWFSNLCEGCQSQIPLFEKLSKEYAKKNIRFVAVSVLGKDRKTVEDAAARYKVSYSYMLDPDGAATRQFSGNYVEGSCPLKSLYVVKKGGEIIFARHLPGTSEKELVAQIETALK
jgi:peroxiredoxin